MNIYSEIRIRPNQTFIAKSFYVKTVDQTFHMLFHSHPYIELMYCNSGSFILDILKDETEKSESFEIAPNKLVLLTSGVYHRIRAEQPTNISNVELGVATRDFEKEHIDFYTYVSQSSDWNKLLSEENAFWIFFDSSGISKNLIHLIKALSAKKTKEDDFFIDSLIYQLLLNVATSFRNHLNKNARDIHINRALQYIHENIKSTLTVQQIAAQANITVSYLERLFKRNLNVGVMQYIIGMRIELAKKALSSETTSVKDIYSKFGFKNRASFVYNFKSFTGKTPSQFRSEINADLHPLHHNNYVSISKAVNQQDD